MIIYRNYSFFYSMLVFLLLSVRHGWALEQALGNVSRQLVQFTEQIDPYHRRWKKDPLAIESLEKFLDGKNKFNTYLAKKNHVAWENFTKTAQYQSLKNAREGFGSALFKNTVHIGNNRYQVTRDMPQYTLKKGDYLYLDGLHHDHLEWFDENKKAKGVINLQGIPDLVKSIDSLEQQRSMDSTFIPFKDQTKEIQKKLVAQKTFAHSLDGKHQITNTVVYKKFRVFQLTHSIPQYPVYLQQDVSAEEHLQKGDLIYLSIFHDTEDIAYGIVWADPDGQVKGVIDLEGHLDMPRTNKAAGMWRIAL